MSSPTEMDAGCDCYPLRIILRSGIIKEVVIKSEGTKDIWLGRNTKAARALLPTNLFSIAARKLSMLAAATILERLRIPPSNHFEALKGERAGQHSIRINVRYRICFKWVGNEATDVEITDYH